MLIGIWRKLLPQATPGLCTIDGQPFGFSLELPWKDNRRLISCVKPGTYDVLIQFSPKYNRGMLTLQNVPGRAGILIHGANSVADLKGCIAIASERVGEDRIRGDLSGQLKERVQKAIRAAERVQIQIINPEVA